MTEPELPWSIQIELVEGCNYSCNFCAIHSVRDPKDWHKYRMMNPDLLTAAFKELNEWRPGIRVEINNNGEPTLHPMLLECIYRIRKAAPQCHIQLQTNCHVLETWESFRKNADLWFKFGLNMLCLNAYRRWWNKKEAMESSGWEGFETRYEMLKFYALRAQPEIGYQFTDFYYNNPHNLSMYHNHGSKARNVVLLDDLGEVNLNLSSKQRKSSKTLTNEAGGCNEKIMEKVYGISKLESPLQKKCTRPFREIILAWDGSIPLCCYSWSSEIVYGKFPEVPLKAIWSSKVWQSVRQLLYNKNRNMTPCSSCDYNGGPRQGFLKDPDLGLPDEDLFEVVADHMRHHQQFAYPHVELEYGSIKLRDSSEFVQIQSVGV